MSFGSEWLELVLKKNPELLYEAAAIPLIEEGGLVVETEDFKELFDKYEIFDILGELIEENGIGDVSELIDVIQERWYEGGEYPFHKGSIQDKLFLLFFEYSTQDDVLEDLLGDLF